MNVSGPGAGIPRQGITTEARIEAPQPQDQPIDRSAPVNEGDASQRPRADAPSQQRVDITV